MNNPDTFIHSLSPGGEDRRRGILAVAIDAARARRRRRRVAQFMAASLCLIVGGGALIVSHNPESARPVFVEQRASRPDPQTQATILPAQLASPVRARRSPAAMQEIVIQRIETDPTLVDRLSIPQEAPTWQRLDDDGLIAELQRAGKPAGIAYVKGRAIIAFHKPPPRTGG